MADQQASYDQDAANQALTVIPHQGVTVDLGRLEDVPRPSYTHTMPVTSQNQPGVFVEEPLSVASPNSLHSEQQGGAPPAFDYPPNERRNVNGLHSFPHAPSPGVSSNISSSPGPGPRRMLSFISSSPSPHDIEAASLAVLQKKWTLLSNSYKSKCISPVFRCANTISVVFRGLWDLLVIPGNSQAAAEVLMKQAAATAQVEELVQHLFA
jgi:hypothetical protein